jgi:hypothetical protein
MPPAERRRERNEDRDHRGVAEPVVPEPPDVQRAWHRTEGVRHEDREDPGDSGGSDHAEQKERAGVANRRRVEAQPQLLQGEGEPRHDCHRQPLHAEPKEQSERERAAGDPEGDVRRRLEQPTRHDAERVEGDVPDENLGTPEPGLATSGWAAAADRAHVDS